MRILVVGASGMLGHKVALELQRTNDVIGWVRRDLTTIPPQVRCICRQIAEPPQSIAMRIETLSPDYIINCAGAIKHRAAAKDGASAYIANIELPFSIARAASAIGARTIHVSTDCVFDGQRIGHRPFTLNDMPDATDPYGVSKRIGELAVPGAMTLRTSIVGPELFDKSGLLEWAISKRGQQVLGYERAIFSGVPTVTLARLIGEIILEDKWRPGLLQVATEPIDKATWLEKVNLTFGLELSIDRYSDYYCDRSLDGTVFEDHMGRKLPPWSELMHEMHTDFTSNADIYMGK